MGNIYEKLFKMREAIKKESFDNFTSFVDIVDKKAKNYKVLPLYCVYDNVATLTLVNIEEVTDTVKFQLPASNSVQKTKEQLYYTAFDINREDYITAVQYAEVLRKMKDKGVPEAEIIKRYKIDSIETMTAAIYERCIRALDRMGTEK